MRCGAPASTIFPARGYGANANTLGVLALLKLPCDSNLDGTSAASKIPLHWEWLPPTERTGVIEVPISWVFDRGERPRHVQAAVSTDELRLVVRQFARFGHLLLTVVSHNSELLNRVRNQLIPFPVHRFEKRCAVLAHESGSAAHSAVFAELNASFITCGTEASGRLRSGLWRTGRRRKTQPLGRLLHDRRKPTTQQSM